jgi:hypothetical protein
MCVIPAALEAEIRRIAIQSQPRQKVNKTPFQLINQVWWHIPVILVT